MTTLHDFTLTSIDGKPMPLAQFKGRTVLLVNTASACGYTPQYEGLEKLWEEDGEKGLTVIGVPCNDFGAQEQGSEAEIGAFCVKNFGVTFPLTAKYSVKGPEANPLFVWAAEQAGELGAPKWNFHKYLFDANGKFVQWFSSETSPTGPKIRKALESLLGE